MLFFSIYDELIEVIVETRFRTVESESPGAYELMNAWPSWIDARRQYILLLLLLKCTD